MPRLLVLLLVLLLSQVSLTSAQGDDTYFLDVINLPNTHSTSFYILYEFDGANNDTDEPVMLTLESTVIIQPEPAALTAIINAEGSLFVYDLVPRDVREESMLHSQQVYFRAGYFTFIELSSGAVSCGKQTAGPGSATNRLEAQLPFPNDIFFENTVPGLPRLDDNDEFDGHPTVLYGDTVSNQAIEGTFTVAQRPDTGELISFTFDGSGKFHAPGDITLDGDLSYTFERLTVADDFIHQRPTGCQEPAVQNVPVYEPSANWLIREDVGEYTTNQGFETLAQFYADALINHKLVRDEEPTPNQRLLTYTAPNGDTVQIGFLDLGQEGVEVNILILPGFQ
ncbi:MAG: hypothetical protein L0154_12575 [Chloroflexi bacterium]|nr:hypothetical protein [Chloroflexota bacterium]